MAFTLAEFLRRPHVPCPFVYTCTQCNETIGPSQRLTWLAGDKPAHEECADKIWDDILVESGGAIGHGRARGPCRQVLGPND